MKRFWTTAAVAALCAFGTGAWAAPQTQYLELVASQSLRGSQEGASATRHRHKKAELSKTAHSRRGKGKKAEETASRGRRGRRHAEAVETTHGRRGRHRVAVAEAETPARGRHGRRHIVEAAEVPERGRHGRHQAFRSEIREEGGASVKVGRHDTLESISHRTGVFIPELARLNGLKRPYHVRVGERLKLPARRYYVVKSGDTLYSLARKFDVETSELASANGVAAGRRLRAGQKLYLPSGAAEAAPPEEVAAAERPAPRRRAPTFTEPFEGRGAYQPPPSPEAETPAPARPVTIPQGPSPYQPAPPAGQAQGAQGFELTPPPRSGAYQQPGQAAPPETTARPLIPTSPPPNPADVAAAGRGKFVWPVQGQVISPFGHKPDGTSNDGLNISANAGDPVRAAADGEVVYAGDQVPSFGNLVLIKHAGGWVTAYAHMSHILVKNRDEVVQGQEIGAVGQTGSVDRPQVHFEIRYAPSPKDKATPVDPTLLLPQR